MAKRSFEKEIHEWARIGAERRLVEIADEAAAIHRAFPELRDRHETRDVRAANSAVPPKTTRRRRRMSTVGRERLRAALKKRWAAAKKAGKTKLS